MVLMYIQNYQQQFNGCSHPGECR